MKKYYTVLFMVIPLCLLLSCTASTNGIEFAVDYNNTAQAEDIVSNIYNSNMIDDLVDSESACKFSTLYDLAEYFAIECVRAPQEYEQS